MSKLSRSSDGDLFSFLPPGSIISYSSDTPPQGWLICDGSEISRTLYPELFLAIGTKWGIGDGSATFNLPNLQGKFLRGSVQDMDPLDAAQRDPDYATRESTNGGNSGGEVGTSQGDAIRNIKGQFGTKQAESYATGVFADIGSAPGMTNSSGTGSGISTLYEFDASTGVNAGSDTRPANAAVNYIIRIGAPKEGKFVPTITTTEPDPTLTNPIPVEIDLQEEVVEFDSSDLTTTNCSIENFSEVSSTVYTADLVPDTIGTVGLTLPEDSVRNFKNITNEEVNFNIEFGVLTIDPVITTAEPDPTSTSPISFSVDFTEAVTGFDLSDINVTNGTPSNLLGGPQVYTFDVTPTADGDVTVTVPFNSATGQVSGYPNSQAQYIIEYVAPLAPVTTTVSTTELDPTSTSPIPYTVTFSEDVTGFDITDLSITNGTPSNFIAVNASTYTFDVTPGVDGGVIVTVPAASATSIANGTPNDAGSDTITYQAPSVFGLVKASTFNGGDMGISSTTANHRIETAGNGTLTEMTITGWVKFSPTNKNRFMRLMSATAGGDLEVRYDFDTEEWYLRKGTNTFTSTAGFAWADYDVWHHIAIVWDGQGSGPNTGKLQLYVDGIAVINQTSIGLGGDFSQSLDGTWYLAGSQSSSLTFAGKIASLEFWDKALVSLDIQNLNTLNYQQTPTAPGATLVRHYLMGDHVNDTSTVIFDNGADGVNATYTLGTAKFDTVDLPNLNGIVPANYSSIGFPIIDSMSTSGSWNFSANPGTDNHWTINNFAVPTAGTNSFLITDNTSLLWGYNTTTSNAIKVHFYRDIAIPAGVDAAEISILWRCSGETSSAILSDYGQMSIGLASTAATPAAGTRYIGDNEYRFFAEDERMNPVYVTGTNWTAFQVDVSQYIGQTIRVVFSWENDTGLSSGTAPTNIKPFAIDQFILKTHTI